LIDAIADEFRAIAADFGRNLISDAIASDFGRNSGAIAKRFAWSLLKPVSLLKPTLPMNA